MNELHWSIYLAGLAVIVSLACYAGYLLNQVRVQTKKQHLEQEKRALAARERKKSIVNSLNIICKSVVQEQCDISEGSWRISVLLESIGDSEFSNSHLDYPSIFALYNGIKHMPILEQRKKLAKQERMKHDLERAKLEAKLTDAVIEDVQRLALNTTKILENLT